MSWEKTAFTKLARLGAAVMLPIGDGKYLMQANDPVGKLRPPGGGTDKSDKTLTATMIRELREEFDLDPVEVRQKLKFLGYEYQKPFWGSAIYELRNHGLTSGVYQASNDPDEKIELVECRLSDPRYTGPIPGRLLTEDEAEEQGQLEKKARFFCEEELLHWSEKPPEGEDDTEWRAKHKEITDRLDRQWAERHPDDPKLKEAKLCPIKERLARQHARRNPDIVNPYIDTKSAARGFCRPENWDEITESRGKHFKIFAGGGDWENCWTWLCAQFGGDDHGTRVWMNLDPPKEIVDGSKWNRDWGRSILNKWIALARDNAKARAAEMEIDHCDVRSEDFDTAATNLGAVVKNHGVLGLEWTEKQASAQAAPEAIPTTGPEAIAHALNNLDLDQEEAEAKEIVRRKLKSKRPLAVQKLGFINGLRRAGIHPSELMIHRVPVIPPQFRPYSVSGDVFIPGDANELYRDLINITGVHNQLHQKLGPEAAKANKLRVYDAVRAVYGFGDPVAPKTKERGVSGFLQKITGTSPKFGYAQRKLLSKDMDFVSRGVIGVDPDLHLDQIGIPKDHAWKLYSPYIQRRLVRGGMPMEGAVKAIQDRTSLAEKALNAEMQERPVMYSRAPAWHKFNTVGGWPKLIDGNTILINPLVTTGLGADFDGDTMNVHLPAMPEAVDDVKNKLMPSKMLFSIKDRDKVVPTPKQEQILGLASAQQRPATQKYRFNSTDEAMKAIRSGRVKMSDELEIPGLETGTPKIASTRPSLQELLDSTEGEEHQRYSQFLSSLGLGPLAKPHTPPKCPKCGGDASWETYGEDTPQEETTLECSKCGDVTNEHRSA